MEEKSNNKTPTYRYKSSGTGKFYVEKDKTGYRDRVCIGNS